MWRVADFFCGAGGFSEGFRAQGFRIAFAVDNWNPAVRTFKANHPDSEVVNRDIAALDPSILPKAEVVIGSPPCTSFSSSNSRGRSDPSVGVRLIDAFINLVDAMKPKVWVMENVPRAAVWLKLHPRFEGMPVVSVLNAADYGVPQRRLRLFCGDFPLPHPTHSNFLQLQQLHRVERVRSPWRTMGEVLAALPNPVSPLSGEIVDPLYERIRMKARNLTDQFHSTCLTIHQVERNQRNKTRHPWFGRMRFPDDMNRPARTIQATQIPAARETIVVPLVVNGSVWYRRLTVRECASLQSFPITYKFHGSLRTKYRLVGNAVPPLLGSAIALAVRQAFDL